MGLSSNARLLSITARLTSNEYESQQLSNAKMRLATRSQEVSENYISALNSTNYNFLTFDAAGNSYNSTLTPALLYQYGDSKNQYILTNASGKALISSQDAANFEKSSCLQDFLACYGLEAEYKTDNLKKYYEEIKDEIDIDGGCKTWNTVMKSIKEQIDGNQSLKGKYDEGRWASKKNETYETVEGDVIYGGPQGLYQNALNRYNILISSSNAGYDIDTKDLDAARLQVSATRQNAIDIVTYDSWLEAQIRIALSNKDNTDEIVNGKLKVVSENAENLKKYLPVISANSNTDSTDSVKDAEAVENSGETTATDSSKLLDMSMLNKTTQNFFATIWKMIDIVDSDAKGEDDSSDSEKIQRDINSIDNEHNIPQYSFLFSETLSSVYYDSNFTNPDFYMQYVQDINLYEDLKDFTNNLSSFIANFKTYYESKVAQVNLTDNSSNKLLSCLDTDDSKNVVEDAYKILQDYRYNLAEYNAELERIGITSEDAFTYADATQAQWYTNLWYKLNGASTVKTCTNQSSYSVLDSGVWTSSSWITNAITQGHINIEAASALNCEKTAQDDENPFVFNLSGIKWTSKIFSNCTDIVQSDNDKAVASAEAEYEREMNEINIKDEKYQRQISLLDSQHNALQTEYESVKTAMDKNIERSFKALQG